MDIDWIQTFVMAAEEGNFHRAAERLHLAQPTVSLHVQKLESLWGVTLFERVGRNVQLSRAGHRFLVHARRLLEDYVCSLEDMARWQQGYETTLRIFASPVVATTLLPRWIQGFGRLLPSVEFSVQVVDSEQILPAVLQQIADLGFSRLGVAHPQVSCVKLYEDPVVLIAPRDEFDFEGPVREVRDL
ncbi:MAG: LysR family transcriptional regulator, partial [Sulfobacillus sp.]